jgi:hypothetical protein
VSRAIEPDWQATHPFYAGSEWAFIKWPDKNMMIIGIPGPVITSGSTESSLQSGVCFVANLETGAWCKFTGWDVHCLGMLASKVFFGGEEGGVFECESGGTDNGSIIYYKYAAWPDPLGAKSQHKQIHMIRTTFRVAHDFIPLINAQTNYTLEFPSPPSAASVPVSGDVWDVGLWDVATWDSASELETIVRWVAVGRSGYVIAPTLQLSHSSEVTPRCEFISMDATFESGAVVV